MWGTRRQLRLSALFSAPLFADQNHVCQIGDGTDLPGSSHHSWVLRHQFDRLVQVAGFENYESANLLLCLRIGTVGDFEFAARPTQSPGRVWRLKRFPVSEMAL